MSASPSSSPPGSPAAPRSRSASPVAQQDGLADMFDDVRPPVKKRSSQSPARSNSRTPSPVRPSRSTTSTPTKRPRDTSRSSRSSGASDDEVGRRQKLEYEEDDNAMVTEETLLEANMVLPKIPKLASSDGQAWVLKLPSAITFPRQPFHPDLYRSEQGPIQESEEMDDVTEEQKRVRALNRMHSIANSVRWKWVDGSQGVPVKKSNARVIRWSDGTASLMVGQEMWDLQVESVAAGGGKKPFALNEMVAEQKMKREAEGSLSQSQYVPPVTVNKEGPPSVLFATDFDDRILVADTILTGSISLVAQTRNVRDHQKRVTAVTKATAKKARIHSHVDTSGVRPDKIIEDQVRELQESQRKKLKDRGHDFNAAFSMPVWKGSSGVQLRERDETEPATGAGRKRVQGNRGRADYSSDEDMDVMGPGRRSGGGGYGGGDYESDDFVVDDDEDEDAGLGAKSQSEGSAADSDDLDREMRRATKSSSNPKSSKRAKKSTRDYASEESEEELDLAEREAEKLLQAEKKAKKERKKREREEEQAEPTPARAETTAPMDLDDEDEELATRDQTVIQKRVLRYEDEEDDE